jgi:beta-alanine--pyruvate transaminase
VLDIYKNEALFERSAELSPYWEQGVHSLKGLPNVTDIRNLGMACGIDLAPEGASARAATRPSPRPSSSA